MTHTDKFKTPASTKEYRDNYNKIKWGNCLENIIDDNKININDMSNKITKISLVDGKVNIEVIPIKEFLLPNNSENFNKIEENK